MPTIERVDRTPNTPFFTILAEGTFTPADIIIEVVHGSLKRSVESEKLLEETWQNWPGKKFPNDTQPSRFHVASIKQDGQQLKIQLDPCVSYRDFIGSRHPQLAQTLGEDFMPYPAVVAALLTTSDDKILLGRRLIVDYKSGGLGMIFGGFMEIKKDVDENSKPDMINTLHRELKEELGLKPQELTDVVLRTIVTQSFSPSITFGFRANSTVSSDEIIKRVNDGENSILAAENSFSQIRHLFQYYTHAFCSDHLAVMLSCMTDNYKSLSVQEILQMLELRGRRYDNPLLRNAFEKRDLDRVRRRFPSQGSLRF